MSRNFKGRSAPTPTFKRANSVSSSPEDDSSDDDYRGVDEISDDEEDEPDVEKVEEQHFADSDLDEATPRPSQDDESSWHGCEDTPNFFDEQFSNTALEFDDDWNHTSMDESNIKSVRFLVDRSDDSDMQSVDSNFPDILDKSSLSTQFLRQIDQDPEADVDSDESYWDHNEETEISRIIEEEEERDESDNSDSSDESGYDSDGETTDDDVPMNVKVAGARQVMNQPDPDEANDSSSEEEVVRTRRPAQPRYPRMGKWAHSMSKPFAVLHTNGKNMVYFNSKALRKYGSVASIASKSDVTPTQPIPESSPMMCNSASVMMSAFSSNAFIDSIVDQVAGPMEAFYPWTTVNADGTYYQDNPFADTSSIDEYDLDEGEEQLVLEDFLNMDGESSEDEKENEEGLEPSSDATAEPNSTPARPTPKSQDLLDHFQHVNVASFRRNQDINNLINRSIESKESLAFGGPIVRGLKQDRIQNANIPITPMRKRKVSRAAPLPSSPASPLSRADSKKRRYDGERYNGHKRHKSMV